MPTILTWRLGALGDTLLLLPALAALRAAFPDHTLAVAGAPVALAPARWLGLVDVTLDASAPALAQLWSHTQGVSPWGTSMTQALPPDIETAIVWSANADEIARGLERVGVTRVLTASAVPTDETPTAAHYLRTLAPLGVMPVPFALHAPAGARAATKHVWQATTRLPMGATAPVVLLHPGAGSPTKLWPLAHYRILARRLRDEGVAVVWTAGAADEVIRARLDDSPEQSYVLPTLDLAALTAVIERTTVVVSGDCGVAHLAALAGARGVALFGPTDTRVWGPPSPRTTVVHLSLPCAPCGAMAPACPSRICLRALSVDAVYIAVRQQIEDWTREQEETDATTRADRGRRPSPSRPADYHPPAPVPGPPAALQAAVWGRPDKWVLQRSTEPG